jgi:hypothetical protein
MGDDYRWPQIAGPTGCAARRRSAGADRSEDTMTATTPRGPVLTLVGTLGLALTLVLVNGATTRDAPPVPVTAAPAAVTAAPDPAPPPGSPEPAASASASAPEAAAAPQAAFPTKAKFVGEASTAKGPIPIAITVDGGRAKAYVCDGKKIEAWLQGTAEKGVVELTGRKGARLSGRLVGDAVEGTVELAGYPEWTFSARATKSTRAGLYRASAGGTTTGWIVRDDAGREQVGMLRDASGAERPAPALDLGGTAPAAAVPGTAAPVDGDTDVLPSAS